MSSIPTVTLNNGVEMPILGFGVFQIPAEQTEQAVRDAVTAGYRLIDTAASYGNEEAVGRAIAASGIPRAEIFVTTKLANADQGFQAGQDAFKVSLDKLGLEYVDLYMIHWPAGDISKYVDSWGALIKLHNDGTAKSIGVCNFTDEDLSTIIDLSYVSPVVNQIELHPLLNQSALRAVHAERGIVTQAYSPLGVGNLLTHATVQSIAAEYGKTPAQVLIRWSLQLGNSVIPRSSSPERIAENLDVFGFELAAEHMDSLNGLDDGTRYRPDPATYTGI